jgi:threonine dehydrogenase-like Zn-dependent dehydrogenase
MKPFMVNMFRWHEDCLNIVHTCLIHRTREETVVGVREAFRLVSKGLFNIMPLINRKYRLSEIEEAFQKEQDDRGSVKTLIIP